MDRKRMDLEVADAARRGRGLRGRFVALALPALALAGWAPPGVAEPLQSLGQALSADGRYVGFMSDVPDLVPGQVDDNRGFDVFLRDRVAKTTRLVSHTAGSPLLAATASPAGSFVGPLSADGRWMAFQSDATDLVPGALDANESLDLFLFDALADATTLVTHAAGTPTTAANGATLNVVMSRDGSTVAFSSLATNLVPGQRAGRAGGGGDVFVYHRPSGTLALVSHRRGAPRTTGNGGSLVTGISADGDVLVFTSAATDLVPGTTDGNGATDVFVFERSSGTVSLVSRASGGPLRASNALSAGGQLSGDGRWVAFQSMGTNLVPGQTETGAGYDEFLFDRVAQSLRLVSHAAGAPTRAVGVAAHAWSAGGRYLAFASGAADLVAGQADANGKLDVFLYDRVAGATVLVTHRPGALATTTSGSSAVGLAIDGAGRRVVLLGNAPDLVAGEVDNQGRADAVVYDRVTRGLSLVSHRWQARAADADGGASNAQCSDDGSVVGFTSGATDLLATPDSDGGDDVFAYSTRTRQVEGVSRPTATAPTSGATAGGVGSKR